MPTCPSCGSETGSTTVFCEQCGTRLGSAEAPPVPATRGVVCPSCGADNAPDDVFCYNCAASLLPLQTDPIAEGERIEAPTPAPAVPVPMGKPFLMVVSTGARIPLPDKTPILIGREDPVIGTYPEIDLTPHGGQEGGVSRRHARITIEDDTFFVEDLVSSNSTFVNNQWLPPMVPHSLEDGDELRCGRIAMTFHTG